MAPRPSEVVRFDSISGVGLFVKIWVGCLESGWLFSKSPLEVFQSKIRVLFFSRRIKKRKRCVKHELANPSGSNVMQSPCFRYIDKHPGGPLMLENMAGKDCRKPQIRPQLSTNIPNSGAKIQCEDWL